MHYPFGQPKAGTDVLWRCEAQRYSYVIDPETDRYGTTAPRLEMCWWAVDKRTPKGAWCAGKFVLLTARKKWACNTEDEALESFRARRKAQIRILSGQLNKAKADLALAEQKEFLFV